MNWASDQESGVEARLVLSVPHPLRRQRGRGAAIGRMLKVNVAIASSDEQVNDGDEERQEPEERKPQQRRFIEAKLIQRDPTLRDPDARGVNGSLRTGTTDAAARIRLRSGVVTVLIGIGHGCLLCRKVLGLRRNRSGTVRKMEV